MPNGFDQLTGAAYEQFTKKAPQSVVKKVVKAGAYFRDLRELPKPVAVPPEYQYEGSPEKFRDQLLNAEQVSKLLELIAQFPDNSMHRLRQRVGSKEKGNIHPHDFVVERDGDDTYLYFVDPEQSLQSKIRPKAVYLETMHISPNQPPEIVLFRCRAADLKDPQAIKADALLQEARKLILNRGVPDFIRDKHHREITVRVVVTQQEGIAQIQKNPTVNDTTVPKLLEGQVQSPILDGIVGSHHLRIQQFTKFLERQKIEPEDPNQPRFAALPNEKYKTTRA